MSIASIDAWRLPGCGGDCAPRRHDPYAHEAHGFLLATLAPPTTVVRTGPLVIDLSAGTVTVDGIEPLLTPTERAIMLSLARHAGKVVEARELVAAVWGPEFVAGNLLQYGHIARINICRLRPKIGAASELLQIIRGVGYRLVMGGEAPPVLLPSKTDRQRWARKWDACQWCGTTERQHASRGLCSTCRGRWRRTGRFV